MQVVYGKKPACFTHHPGRESLPERFDRGATKLRDLRSFVGMNAE
jgi:hypothetical protein